MTNSAKGLLSFALVLFFVNGAHFLSDPPLAYKTTLPVYMNIELSESRVWDVEVRTESGKKLNFEDTIRYYAKAIRGKKQSGTEITRHKLLPTTDLTGTRAPVVIAAEISGGRLVESVSLAFSGGMTADDLDAVIFSIGEKVTQLNAEDLLLFPENKDGKYPQRLSIGSQHRLQRSSRDMNPADYIRLKTVNIGYSIPSRFTRIKAMGSCATMVESDPDSAVNCDVMDPKACEVIS